LHYREALTETSRQEARMAERFKACPAEDCKLSPSRDEGCRLTFVRVRAGRSQRKAGVINDEGGWDRRQSASSRKLMPS